MRGTVRAVLFVSLAFLGGACRGPVRHPAWAAALGYGPDELFPVSVGKYGCPTVSVGVNGASVDMVLDTANMTGLALGPGLARRLRLPPVGEWTSLDADGAVLGRYPVFRAEEVAAFGRVWEGVRIHEMESDELGGLLGPRFLLGRRFTLDYGNRVLGVSESPLPTAAPAGEILTLIPSKRYEGMLVVEGTVNGRPALVQVDTGKSRTCVDPGFAAALGLPKSRDGYRIDEVRLGSLSFAVADAKAVGFGGISRDLPSAIVLGIGSDVLSQVLLTVDYPGERLLLAR